MNSLLKVWLIILLQLKFIHTSHFRGGSMAASPKTYKSSSVVMTIYTRWAWRLSYSSNTYCDASVISSRTLMGMVNNILCTQNCLTANEVVGTTVMRCTAFSPANLDDWSAGTYSFDYEFPISNNIEISYSSSAWAILVVNSSPNWDIKLKIDTTNRTDTGRVNSSPQVSIAPIVIVRVGLNYGIKIPYVDKDPTDVVKCRWADSSKNECAGVCNSVPMGVLESDRCYLWINSTEAITGFYAAAIQVEDFANANSTTALSSIPIQFLVWIKYVNTTCQTSPIIVGDLPLDACIVANNVMTTRIVANVSCTTEKITDIQIISDVSLTFGNLININNVSWYKSMTWNPPAATGVNSYLICSTASDTSLLTSLSNCFTFITGIPEPKVNKFSLSPTYVNINVYSSSDTRTFSCSFTSNNMIKPPLNSTRIPYIRIFSKKNNLEMIKFDSSLANTTYFTSSIDMSFNVPVGTLPDGQYYVLFDWGVAVYNGYCLPQSEPITDPILWNFNVTHLNLEKTEDITPSSTCSSILFCVLLYPALIIAVFIIFGIALYFMLRKKNNDMKVKSHLDDETDSSMSDIYCIMTVHDLGCDYTYFNRFVKSTLISSLKNKFKWLHISLPGQEKKVKDLSSNKYPSLIEIADELNRILDENKIDKVICLGDGLGADICTIFSIINPKRCLGLCLIRPNGTNASLNERLFFLTNNSNSNETKTSQMEDNLLAYIAWHRFGTNSNEKTDFNVQVKIKEFKNKNLNSRNINNACLLWSSFLSRTDILKNVNEIKVPVMIVFSKKFPFIHKSRKFYRKLCDSRSFMNLSDVYVYEYLEYDDPFIELSNEFALYFRSFINEISNKNEEEKKDRQRKNSSEFNFIV